MIERVHSIGRSVFALLQKPLSRAFDSEQNPLNYLGALTIFLLLDCPGKRYLAADFLPHQCHGSVRVC